MIFRNRRLVRATACLLLLETFGNVLAPLAATAAMGPSQPEFIGYENPGATDMVNLATGDFTYQLPIFEVPGPERSFQLPLTYRAGIRLEQEASWVGLGWTLNPGAITRTVNGYPDDANGQRSTTSYQCLYDRGWTFQLPGLFTLGWSAESGRSGSVDLLGLASVGWSGGRVSSGDVIGIRYEGEGKAVDVVRLIGAVITIASMGSASAVTGAAGAAAKAGAIGAQVGIEVGKQAVMGVAASLFLGRKSGTSSGVYPILYSHDDHFLGFSSDYKYYHDYIATDYMYGSLYYGNMALWTTASSGPGPTYQNAAGGSLPSPREFQRPSQPYGVIGQNFPSYYSGVAADYQQYAAPSDGGSYYESVHRPISIAHDAFSVMGEGISGNIRPQRLDIGTLAFPRPGSNIHHQYNVVPFLDDYKVGFRYEGSLSNGYTDLRYIALNGAAPSGFDVVSGSGQSATLRLTDPRFQDATRTPADRQGLYGRDPASPTTARRRLVQGRHIAWFNNDEIADMYRGGVGSSLRTGQGLMEYPGFVRSSSVGGSYNPYRVQASPDGIGAFAVTAEDGTTYHYSLPVQQYTQHTRARNWQYANRHRPYPDYPEDGVSRSITGGGTTVSGRTSYAAAWLLTAVTSSDYVDRNRNGVVDSSDWGGWVTLRYGRFAKRYKWQQPYIGEARSMDGTTDSWTQGYKDTYYLNSVSTRSHTALFIKSLRKDGRGHYAPGIYENHSEDRLHIDQQKPSSSLKLDEIVLLTNEDYNKLRVTNGIRITDDISVQDVPAFSTHTADNDTSQQVGVLGTDDLELHNGDSYHNVIDQHDISADPRIDVFIKRRALKRVKFHYSYQLCPLTVSSFEAARNPPPTGQPTQGRNGKLTLKAVSTYGPSPTYGENGDWSPAKLIPDFVFEYDGPNPPYNQDKWDGFGMYSTNAPLNHLPSTQAAVANDDGAAWSLTGITSPLGGRTQISYERDQYAFVSDQAAHQVLTLYSPDNSLTVQHGNLNMEDYLLANEPVHVTGTATWQCIGGIGFPIWTQTIDQDVTIAAVSGNSIRLPQSLDINSSSPSNCYRNDPKGMWLKIIKERPKYGGDIRVAAITTTDEVGASSRIEYKYVSRNPINGNPPVTSGVVSQEPEWIKDMGEAPISTDYDYPTTPVMYANVDVLRGPFRVSNDWDVKEEYTFFTPQTSMITTTSPLTPSGFLDRRTHHKVINLGKIGQLSSVRKLNKRGEIELATTMEYDTELPNQYDLPQGKFTEGAMLHDYLDNAHYIINRTTKEYVPTVLNTITTTSGGLTTRLNNEGYDFYSGQVVATTTSTSTGEQWRSLQVPAYALNIINTSAPGGQSPAYPTMGAKGDDPANRNLLTLPGAAYTYLPVSGQHQFTPNLQTLLSASVQTWKSDWDTYREWSVDPVITSATILRYHNGSGSPAPSSNPTAPIWRQYQSWVWNSPSLNTDGTYAGYVPFDWAPAAVQSQFWLETSRSLRYDHFSSLLETRAVNKQNAAQKNGYGDYLPLAQAANASYTEMAFSGAEDLIEVSNGTSRFGGEVMSKSLQSPLYAHTGQYSVAVAPGGVGFYYWVYPYLDGLAAAVVGARKYRASVWVRNGNGSADPPAGRLFVRFGTTATATSPTVPQLKSSNLTLTHPDKAGPWYLVNFTFSMPTLPQDPPPAPPVQLDRFQVYIGCENTSATTTAYFDDFRVQPIQAPMTAYVYDGHTHQRTHTLDNDNLYTRTEYDVAGQVKRVYREVLDAPGRPGGERIVSERETNYRRWKQPTWVRTGTRDPAPNSPDGIRQVYWHEVDVNTASDTYDTSNDYPPASLCPWCP